MNKLSFIKAIVAITMGVLLLLVSIDEIATSANGGWGGWIALGVVGMLSSACFIVYGVLKLLFSRSGKSEPAILNDGLLISTLLIYFFLFILLILINSGGDISPSNWVISLLFLTLSLAAAIFCILSFFKPSAFLSLLKDATCGGFIAIYLVAMAAGYIGISNGTIGSIDLSYLIDILGFAFFVIVNLKSKITKKNDKHHDDDDDHDSVLTDGMDIN